MSVGYQLLDSLKKGEGVFSTKTYNIGDIVMIGEIEKSVSKNHSHASQVSEYDYVLHGGLVSKVNHSCSPNCGIKLNKTGAHDFVARKLIYANEEITFDYAMRNYSIQYFPSVCQCGSKCCRGRITGWKDLATSRKRDYDGFVAPYLLQMDIESAHMKQTITE